MEALSLIRRILVILGLCLKDSVNPNDGRVMNCTIVLLLTGFLLITLEFILSHFDETADALYAIMQFVTFFTVWTCYICFANQKHLTFEFLTNQQKIVDNYCKYSTQPYHGNILEIRGKILVFSHFYMDNREKNYLVS